MEGKRKSLKTFRWICIQIWGWFVFLFLYSVLSIVCIGYEAKEYFSFLLFYSRSRKNYEDILKTGIHDISFLLIWKNEIH